MNLDAITSMLSGLLPYGLVAFLGLIFAGLAGVMLIAGNRIHPALVAFGAGLTAIGSATTAWWALPGDPTAATALEALKLASVTRFAAWFGISLVGFASLALCAAAGARGQPRDTRAAGLVGAGGLVVAILSALGGVMAGQHGSGFFFYARAAEYAFLALLLAGASLAGGPKEGPGRTAAAAAAVVFALVVAVCEVGSRGATWFFLLLMIGTVASPERPTVIRGYLELTGVEVPWLLATMAAASCVAVLGVGLAAREDNRVWLALIWLPVVPLLWWAGTPSLVAVDAAAAGMP